MRRGFTLLEFVIACAIFFSLALVMVNAIHPARSVAISNNAQRWNDVNSILNGVHEYSLDHNGRLPAGINGASKEICRLERDCTGLADLSVLLDEKIMLRIPYDPTGSARNGTGYLIRQDARGRLFVAAPQAELDDVISVIR
ncbi:MAG: type II secretion system protein [Patescibacteria group bacterium]